MFYLTPIRHLQQESIAQNSSSYPPPTEQPNVPYMIAPNIRPLLPVQPQTSSIVRQPTSTCLPSQVFSNPVCSPLTTLLLTIYILCILAALYTILRSLRSAYIARRQEIDAENEAHERLLRREEEDSWSPREGCNGGCGYDCDGGCDDLSPEAVRTNSGEYGDEDSDDDTVRTTIPRKLAGLGSRVPRIGWVKDSTVAQRRLGRHYGR